MMKEENNVMLISPSEVKANGYVNYNVDEGTIGYTIRVAQDMYLTEITGKPLLQRLQQLIYNAIKGEGDNIDSIENADYAELLDEYVKPYLVAKVELEILMPLTYKVRNSGVSKNSDTNIEGATMYDIKYLVNYLKTHTALYATRLSKYLCENKSTFVELDGCERCGKPFKLGAKFHPTTLYLGTKGGCCNG